MPKSRSGRSVASVATGRARCHSPPGCREPETANRTGGSTMRFGIAALALASALAAVPSVAAECSAWNLGGFEIGMTKADVGTVRPGLWTNATSFTAKDGDHVITARLDSSGVMISAFSQRKIEEWDALTADLTRRCGTPTVERAPVPDASSEV